MSILLKLTALAVLLTLVTAGVVGVVSYKILERRLIDATFESLVVLRQTKLQALENEYASIERAMQGIASAPGAADLFREVREQYRVYPHGSERLGRRLRWMFGVGNQTRARRIMTEERAVLRSMRNAIEAGDALLAPLIAELGFDDFYVVMPDGLVVYQRHRGVEFGRLVGAERELRGSGLAKTFERTASKGWVTVTSSEPYLPAGNTPKAFVALPVKHDGEVAGVLIGSVPATRFARLLDISAGLGASGEAYLVGPDLLTRGSSRAFNTYFVQRYKADTPMVRAALDGRTGRSIGRDYRGDTVLSAFAPFEYRTITLAMIAEISRAEILAPLRQVAYDVLILVGITSLVLTGLGLLMASGLARPLVQLSEALRGFAETRQLTEVPHTGRRDEIGRIARVVAAAGSEIQDYLARQERTQAALQRSETQFKAVVDQLPSAISLRDDGGGYLFVNERQRQWLDAGDMFEVLGATPAEFFDGETVAELERLERKARDGEVVYEHEMHFDWPDGRHRSTLITKFPLLTEDGELLAIGTVATDVTEIRQAEADLRLALSYLPGGLYRFGPDETLQLYNDNWKELLGYPDDLAVVGVTMDDLAKFRWQRGDYGENVPVEELLVEMRSVELDQQGAAETLVTEEYVGDRILEAHRSRTPDGGHIGVIRDITERRAAEAALAKSEERFRAIVDQLPGGVVVKDTQGRYELVNDTYAEWMGIEDRATALGRTAADFLAPETYRTVANDEARIRETHEVIQHELTIDFADGTTHNIISSQFPIVAADGTLFGIGAALTDVTEVRRMEAVMRLALDNMPGGLVKLDADRRIQVSNEKWRELYDVPDELAGIGQPIADLLTFRQQRGDKLIRVGDATDATALGDLAQQIADAAGENLITEEDVGGRILESQRSRTSDGGYISVVRDITDRRAAEQALAESEERFRTIVDQLPNGVIVKDLQGRYELVNAVYCAWYGVEDREAAIGKTAAAYISPEAYEIVRATERQTIETRKVMNRELSTRFADGEAHSIITSQFPLVATDGSMFGIGAVLTDITEQKQAQERLARALAMVHESVEYAGRIQRALLPEPTYLDDKLGEHFVIWEPKDGVGGDLFWVSDGPRGVTACLFDCTGHGVPGALMTSIAVAALNNADDVEHDPAALIAYVNRHIKESLGQVGDAGEGGDDSDDGLEMGVVHIPVGGGRVVYAGARFQLVVMHGDELEIVQGDRSGVGYRRVAHDQAFTNHDIVIDGEVALYMYTDGITDQIGGPKRRAFGRKRLLELLSGNRSASMDAQRAAILDAFAAYQGAEPRRDDVSMLGVRLTG